MLKCKIILPVTAKDLDLSLSHPLERGLDNTCLDFNLFFIAVIAQLHT